MDAAGRAQLLFAILLGMGVMGFLFLCVSASTCGACYVDPCVHPPGLKTLYKVNSSLCFAGVTSGMFFCFLSGWGALLTLRRRASVMGFGHFFGSCCVSFLVAVQAAGMWGAEATLLEEFGDQKIFEEAIVDGMYEQVRVRPNKALHKSARFLFTTSVLLSLALMVLAPLYFLSRDVYEDNDEGERGAESLRRAAADVANRASRNRHISAYNPIQGPDRTYGGDDERQHLGRAALPLRPLKKEVQAEPGGGV